MRRLAGIAAAAMVACGGGNEGTDGGRVVTHDAPPIDAHVEPPPATCAAGATPQDAVAAPVLIASLGDRWNEGWLGSPVVADLDADGAREIVAARAGVLLGWHLDGTVVLRVELEGRIWASPIVADLAPDHAGLEIAFAERGNIHLVGADGAELPGFPFAWRDELRSIAAGDVDGDGALELVAVTTSPLESGGLRDIVIVVEADGTMHPGFPANTTGASGCTEACYVTGGYDQNLALGDVTGDSAAEIFATQDNAYLSLHEGDGTALAASPIFEDRPTFLGVRFLHDYAEAQQGWAEDEATALQAHFTNSAPAIVDLDGDGARDLVVLGSVQNAAQTDRLRGVGLWALHPDGTRLADWITPFHAPDYLAGLWDFEGENIVGATNQVSVADLFPDRAGPELVFAGFDGRVHCVDARAQQVWEHAYTTSDRVLTTGVAIADLSQDGSPEIVLATYSPDVGAGELVILAANGERLHTLALPGRGAMSVPTIDDADGDGDLDIVVALKGGEDREPMVLVLEVPGSAAGCMPWPTGRRDALRGGWVP